MVQMNPQVPTDVTDDDKLWALLSWLLAPWVPILILLLEDKKNRPFLKYNAIQALALGIVNYVVSGILVPILGIGCFTGLVVFVYWIYLAVQAYKGVWVTIPVLTDFCKGQGWIS